MKDFRKFLEIPKEEREAMPAEATHRAMTDTSALGLPTTHGDDKVVYRLYPDGNKEYTERYEEEKKNVRR
jgi:hypothetical protein